MSFQSLKITSPYTKPAGLNRYDGNTISQILDRLARLFPHYATIGVLGTEIYAQRADGSQISTGTLGVNDAAVWQAMHDDAPSNSIIRVKRATYTPLTKLLFTKPLNIQADLGTIMKSPAGDYAIKIGNGSTRVADNFLMSDLQFKPQTATSKGGVELDLVVNSIFSNVIMTDFEALNEYAFKSNNSWETVLNRCRFNNNQNDLILSGGGYLRDEFGYYNALDVGAKGATENFGINCSNGQLYAHETQFETNPTTGTAVRINFPGGCNFEDVHWEAGQNKYDIRVTTNPLNYPNRIYGWQPNNAVEGYDVYPGGILFIDGKKLVELNHDALVSDAGSGGTVTKHAGGVRLETGTTNGNVVKAYYLQWGAAASLSGVVFRRNPLFEMTFWLSNVANTEYWLVWGRDPQTIANKHFGIHIKPAGALWLTSGDGSVGSEVDMGMTLVVNTRYRIRCRLSYPTARLSLLISGNSQSTSKSTNLPDNETSTNDLFYMEAKTNEAVNKIIDCTYPSLKHD